MDEREILEKIAGSAEYLQVPEELKPDQVRKQLTNRRRKYRRHYRAAAAAACLCICFGVGGLVYQNDRQQSKHSQVQEGQTEQRSDLEKEQLAAAWKHEPAIDASKNGDSREDAGEEDAAVGQEKQPVKKLGNMYTLASDYGSVYDTLKEAQMRQTKGQKQALPEYVAEDSDSADQDTGGSLRAENDTAGFSTTNLQVAGVDESDYVKTDGDFLYVVQEGQIQILDVRGGSVPTLAGTIRPGLDEDTDRICEMYVADRMLTVIIQTENTALEQTGGKEDQDIKLAEEDTDVQYIDTMPVTKVVTYDILDPEHPVQKASVEQDGWYQTSRKTGGRLYLFTNQSLGISETMPRKEAVSGDALRQWVPSVNGNVVSSDCIYLQKDGRHGVLMAAVDLADHCRVLDTKLLVNQYVSLYVSKSSVYLYDTEYVNGALRTRIARFALEADGTIQAKAAKTVKGGIEDTFAIHEKDGYLQVLTSVTTAEPWENRVYVLDENMQTVGKLTGLAKGERIYAARFTGDIGYFVTYRNTDPLFTVDFSNPEEPRVIGELKVTGFSEYLHFWSDDRLLGIGFETDPDSGQRIGVKLSMFDISDPVRVREEAKLVLKGVDDWEGMYNYKAVLVSPQKNLIAFTTKTYQEMCREDYRVFSYENGEFVSRIERRLSAGERVFKGGYWRSVYVGDRLYLISEKKTLAFAMEEKWKETGRIVY